MATLAVLVHETAHATSGGSDGSKEHVAEIEAIWSGVCEVLLTC